MKDNLVEWINLSFSKFYEKPVIMYLIGFERLLRCFYSRYIILNDEVRENFENKLSNFYEIQGNIFPKDYADYGITFKISNKKFFRENSPKELPSFANDLAELIDEYILNNLNIILNKYYVNGNFLENDCSTEFKKLKRIVVELEKLTEKEFNEKNMGNLLWLTGNIEQTLNSNSDFSIDRTCEILDNYSDGILQELSYEISKKGKEMLDYFNE